MVTTVLLLLGTPDSNARDASPEATQPRVRNFIQSLLIDKEVPVLGIRWLGEVFVDAPINGEPEGSQIILRRGQVALSRGFGAKWSGKVTLNYNDAGKFELGDNYLRYSGWKTAIVDAGIFNPAFSLESISKTAGITFMERALPVVALSENKSGGISVLKRTPNSILNAGFFFLNPEQDDKTQPGKAIVLHYAHSPIDLLGTQNLHVGASFSYRFKANPNNTVFKSRPEITTAEDYYVDTYAIDDADKVIRLGLEAHKEWGRLSLQSEVLLSEVRRNKRKSLNFWGAYTYLSWFLSNDRRNFDSGQGKFLAVEPGSPLGHGGKGAFELAFRASYVDLTDKDVIGGRQSNLTLGLNWYLNNHFRVMTNLTKVLDVKRRGGEFDGLDPLILSIRLQWQML